MFSRWMLAAMLVAAATGVMLGPASLALEPADPDLMPEARRLLDYLESQYGREILTGISRFGGGPPAVLHRTGREPAVSGTDIYGFHTKFGEQYHSVVRGVVADCTRWWHQKGGIVTLHYHWGKPGDADGSAWVGGARGTGRLDLARAATPGTEEHDVFIQDLSVTADYLQQLADAKVPVLWRPFHEIDGGWFWWTDAKTPENTAALWRAMFDYLVKERGLHNLIWVYNAAHRANALGRDATFEENVAHRRRFYPGAAYVDIASIDTYANRDLGWGAPQDDARRRAHELMEQVSPGKILAIAEDSALVNPDVAQEEGPSWLYCLAWFAGDADWMRHAYRHEHMLTLDELPLLVEHNVMPNVRIEGPADGAVLDGPNVELEGRASDRNGNLEGVTIHALSGPWLNWFERGDAAVAEAIPEGTRLGEAQVEPGGRWTFTWRGAPAGYHNLVAFARDAAGAVACSNGVRVTVGIGNLARGRLVSASSTSEHGGELDDAVDGDPNTMWWSDKAQPDPQWLAVDLGSARTVGGVSVTWWKAYARAYTVQVSSDGSQWREVAGIENRRNHPGDSDLIRFEPVQARHVRLHCTGRAVDWQAYTVFELGIYEAIPE